MRRMTKSHRFFICVILIINASSCVKQDKVDAEQVATRVHSQFRTGDYAMIYRESSPQFREIGSESQFVSKMRQFYGQHGSLESIIEIAYEREVDVSMGELFSVTFSVKFTHDWAKERMVFIRSDKGNMQLCRWDIEPME
jgi:hypothetical protein